MGLNGKSSAVEGRPDSDVRHGASALAFTLQQRSRDINSAGGQQFLVRSQVQGGECKFAARSRSAHNRSCQHERPTQQPTGLRDLSLGKFVTNHSHTDYFGVRHDWREAGNVKIVLYTQGAEKLR